MHSDIPKSGENAKQPSNEDAALPTDALQQSLAAASNYIGVARLLFQSDNSQRALKAQHNLAQAEAQILRAGEIVRRIRAAIQA